MLRMTVAARTCTLFTLAILGLCALGVTVDSHPAAPAPAYAAPPAADAVVPEISLPDVVRGDEGAFIKITATTNGSHVRWVVVTPGLNPFPADLLRDPKSTVVTGRAGTYRLLAYTALGDIPSDTAETLIQIGPQPEPTPPGPGPQPEPTPPGPGPQPEPDPAPTPQPPAPAPGSISVLIVYESADLNKYTAAQMTAIHSTKLREYMNRVCAKGPGNAPEWRVFDKDADLTHESEKWKKAMANPRPSVPCIAVSNGVTGEVVPLVDEASALEFLQKWGGK